MTKTVSKKLPSAPPYSVGIRTLNHYQNNRSESKQMDSDWLQHDYSCWSNTNNEITKL